MLTGLLPRQGCSCRGNEMGALEIEFILSFSNYALGIYYMPEAVWGSGHQRSDWVVKNRVKWQQIHDRSPHWGMAFHFLSSSLIPHLQLRTSLEGPPQSCVAEELWSPGVTQWILPDILTVGLPTQEKKDKLIQLFQYCSGFSSTYTFQWYGPGSQERKCDPYTVAMNGS